MKHLLQKTFALKALLLMSLLVGAVNGAWAEEVTVDFSAQGYTNAQQVSETIVGDITVSFTNGSTPTAYYDTGTGIRIYGGGSASFSAGGAAITQVTLTFDSSNKPTSKDVWSTEGKKEVSNDYCTWRGNATSVTISRPSGSGHWRLKKAVITYESNAASTTTTIDASGITNFDIYAGTNAGTLTAVVKDDSNSPISGAAVTWVSSNEGVATINDEGIVTLVAAGITTITASYAGVKDEYLSSFDTYELTVTDSTPIPTHTVTFSVNGAASTQDFEEGAAITFPGNPAEVSGKTFVGWTATVIDGTTNAAPEFVKSATMGQSDVTFYAVFANAEASGDPVEKKAQTLQYDNWTYSGTTTDKSSYRLFGNGSYIESAPFDLSTLSKVIVYGGTFGGGSFNTLTIGDETNIWKEVTVSGSNQTGVNTYTKGNALTGTKKLLITSTSGNGSSTGVRISKIEIFTSEPSIVYSEYCTTVVAATVARPEIAVEENPFLFSTTATITCGTEDATIYYRFNEDEEWAEYSEALTLTATTTIYAKAVKGNDESSVATVTATKNLAVPTVTIDATGITNTNVYEGTAAGSLAASVTYDGTALEGATITWSGDNDAVALIDAQTGAVTLVAAGSVTFTATYAGNEDYSRVTPTYTLTVTNSDPNVPGTENNPYTVAEARAAIDAGTGVTGVYATGIVSEIVTPYSSQYGNITYNISTDGSTESDQLQAYRGKDKDGEWFTSEDDVQIGDVVVVYGDLKLYKGTYEFGQDNQRISYERPVVTTPSITLEQYEYNLNAEGGDTELLITCTNMPEDPQLGVVFVEADGVTVATYDWISAEINENGNIAGQIQANTGEARTAYFIVTGKDGDDNVVKSDIITINQAAPAAPNITFEKSSIEFIAGGEKDRKLSFNYESLGDNPTFEICFYEEYGTTSATYDWVTTATIEDNKVNLAVAANEGEARSAYFKVHAVGTEVYSNLVTINQAAYEIDYATLPFNWEGGASADLKALNGVTTNGLGSDYAESNKPYLVKFDSDNDYIQVKTDSRLGVVSVAVKMIGGANSSKITVQESADGETFTNVQELAISGKANDILELETTNTFAEDSRYVRLTFTKGSNVGVGPISISEYVAPSTEPSIELSVNEVEAPAEGKDGTITVTYNNITSIEAEVQFCDAEGTTATYDWIVAEINAENNIEYVIDANEGEARTAYMKVYALDDEAHDVYSELITISQAEYVAPLPAVTYSLAKTITSGKHYLITDGSSMAMGADKGNNRYAVSVETIEGKFSVTDEEVKEVVICGPDAHGYYTLYADGYLYAASNSSNYLKTQDATDAYGNGLWSIVIDEETGVAAIKAQGSNERNLIRYNSGNSIFSCYAYGQNDIYLYERDDEEAPAASYSRASSAGNWGTICLPNTATITGAELYSIAGVDSKDAPSVLYLNQVMGTAVAGTPYLFKATESAINAYYTGNAVEEAGKENGLVGSLERIDVAEGMYLLTNNEIRLCGTGCSIAANRAYINMEKVLPVQSSESTGNLVKLFFGGADAIRSLDADSLNGAAIYDLSGRRLNKAQKGLYIVNGKKVSVK